MEDGWKRMKVRKSVAVVRCNTCGNIKEDEEQGYREIGTRVMLHCPVDNANTTHVVIERIFEVKDVVEVDPTEGVKADAEETADEGGEDDDRE